MKKDELKVGDTIWVNWCDGVLQCNIESVFDDAFVVKMCGRSKMVNKNEVSTEPKIIKNSPAYGFSESS